MDSMKFEYDIENLWTGGNYGNLETFARTSSRSNLYGLWCSVDDQHYCGKMHISYYMGGERIHSKRTEFGAAHQTTYYPHNDVEISKTFFLPYWDSYRRVVYFIMKVKNFTDKEKSVAAVCDIEFPEFLWPDYTKMPDIAQKRKKMKSELVEGTVVSKTVGKESEVRLCYCTAELQAHFFSDRGASLSYQMVVPPHGTVEEAFIMVVSNEGADHAFERLEEVRDYRRAFKETYETVESLDGTSSIMLPDPTITNAIRWAKQNVVREEKLYPSGLGFTNDPPQDVLVVRDAAWFALGSDYLTPQFSKGMLQLVKDWGIEEGGKITEYILACENPPVKYDYELNINDDTPLYVWSIHHHYAMTRDEEFLKNMYPVVKSACNWIIDQIRAGLVRTFSEQANGWGISGWRNIIPEYQISGAVTEINAESYYALTLAAELAEVSGDSETAKRYIETAETIKTQMNRDLVSQKTGMYMLNITPDEEPVEVISGDLVFPVMFNVADEEMSTRILSLLYTPDFWTEYGVRTVPKFEPDYDPEFGVRLMGGIWPNLTAWIAFAMRKQYPERMIEAMRNIFRISEAPVPKGFKNAVPGQFPECLHGENFQSRGMTLSPWMPPTYLWLAVEGLLGVEPHPGKNIRVNPNISKGWDWAAIKNMPYNGTPVTFFLYEGILYSNVELDTNYRFKKYDEDVSHLIKSDGYYIALGKDDEVIIFVASQIKRGIKLEVPGELTGGEDVILEMTLNPGDSKLITFNREKRG